MKKAIGIALSFALINIFISCKKENVGVSTVLKGHVADSIRKMEISGYKIVLVKSSQFCANWECGLNSIDVATTYTDNKGDYSITFNYKLKPGESYGLQEQYYGIPYYPEYYSASGAIVAGATNTDNIYVWKPINLKLNLNILNNNLPPLVVRNELATGGNILFNTESTYEQNIQVAYSFRSRPNSDINFIFAYYTESNGLPVPHQMIIPFHTTFDDITTLNYTIDCSKF
ncbi:MAG: hypothetical protein ABI267_03645 [Ginsengibacter sp.]